MLLGQRLKSKTWIARHCGVNAPRWRCFHQTKIYSRAELYALHLVCGGDLVDTHDRFLRAAFEKSAADSPEILLVAQHSTATS